LPLVILGSKPEPALPEQFDKIFFINGSISNKSKLNINDDVMIYHYITYAMIKKDHTALNSLQGESSHKLIISGGESSKLTEYLTLLEENNYTFEEIELLTRKERTKITNQVIGKSVNLKIAILRKGSIRNKLINVIDLLKENGKERASYNPSSAVKALLYVLYNKIGTAPYCLCGVGVVDDGHCYNKGLSFNIKHLYYDLSILRALAQNPAYNKQILVTDELLSESTNLPCYPVAVKV